METKKCKDCGKTKPLHDFGKVIRSVDGRRGTCKECRNSHKRITDAADYEALLIDQNNKCGICGIDASEYEKKFSVDHAHDADQDHVRGLLCQSCNVAIGLFDEDVEYLKSAIGYLLHHKNK